MLAQMRRCPTTKQNSRPVLLLIQKPVLDEIDRVVRLLDTDRSKFIRAAVREKIEKSGMNCPES